MLVHKGSIEINTKRLKIRKFRHDDAEDMFKNWTNDEEVTRYLTWKPHRQIEVTRGLLELWIKDYACENNYNWIIVCKESDEAIGGISVVKQDDASFSCEIGYCLSKQYWGQGIVSEALGAVIDFLIGEIGYNRISAVYDTDNPASGRVMEKNGMTYEGTLRQAKLTNDGKLCDLAMFSILKEEWQTANRRGILVDGK